MNSIITGIILIVLSAAVFLVAAINFPWFNEHFPSLCHWGRWTRWPASKGAILLGSFMGVLMGLMVVFDHSYPVFTKICALSFLGLLVVSIPLAVRDFRRSRKKPPPP